MRKNLISALLIFAIPFISLPSFAQLFFGPKVGFNIATLSNTTLSVHSQPGWDAGVYLNLPMGTHFSVMPEAVYFRRGFKYSYTTTTSNNTSGSLNLSSDVNATLGYLDIPVMLTIWPGPGEGDLESGFFIQVGPQFSYLINDNADVSTTVMNGTAVQNSSPEAVNKISFHHTDLSITGGVGYKFPLLVMVYLRGTAGFAKVQQGDYIRVDDEGHNLAFELGAALTFGAK